MNTTSTTQAQIKVSVSSSLQALIKYRAEMVGVPVTQYVKNLIINDVKNPIFQVSKDAEKRIGQSLKDLKKGRYTVIKNAKELDAHLDSLSA